MSSDGLSVSTDLGTQPFSLDPGGFSGGTGFEVDLSFDQNFTPANQSFTPAPITPVYSPDPTFQTPAYSSFDPEGGLASSGGTNFSPAPPLSGSSPLSTSSLNNPPSIAAGGSGGFTPAQPSYSYSIDNGGTSFESASFTSPVPYSVPPIASEPDGIPWSSPDGFSGPGNAPLSQPSGPGGYGSFRMDLQDESAFGGYSPLLSLPQADDIGYSVSVEVASDENLTSDPSIPWTPADQNLTGDGGDASWAPGDRNYSEDPSYAPGGSATPDIFRLVTAEQLDQLIPTLEQAYGARLARNAYYPSSSYSPDDPFQGLGEEEIKVRLDAARTLRYQVEVNNNWESYVETHGLRNDPAERDQLWPRYVEEQLIPSLEQEQRSRAGGAAPDPAQGPLAYLGDQDLQATLDGARGLKLQNNVHQEWQSYIDTHRVTSGEGDWQDLWPGFFAENDNVRQLEFNNLDKRYAGPETWEGGTGLEGRVATAFGMQPLGGDPALPQFSGEQHELLQPITEKVRAIGGENPQVQIMPTYFVSDEGRVQKNMLLLVTGTDGARRLVDQTGRDYDDADDYLSNHRLSGSGTLYMSRQLAQFKDNQLPEFHRDGQGNVIVSKARIEESGIGTADTFVAYGTTAATVLTFTPLAPIAGPLALAGGTYLGVRSGQRIADMATHGESLATFEGGMEVASAVTAALPLAAGVTRSVGLFRAGMETGAAARTGFGFINYTGRFATPYAGAAGIVMEGGGRAFRVAQGLDVAGLAIGTPLLGVSGANLVAHWEEISQDPAALANELANLATGVYGTGMAVRGLTTQSRARSADIGPTEPEFSGPIMPEGVVNAELKLTRGVDVPEGFFDPVTGEYTSIVDARAPIPGDRPAPFVGDPNLDTLPPPPMGADGEGAEDGPSRTSQIRLRRPHLGPSEMPEIPSAGYIGEAPWAELRQFETIPVDEDKFWPGRRVRHDPTDLAVTSNPDEHAFDPRQELGWPQKIAVRWSELETALMSRPGFPIKRAYTEDSYARYFLADPSVHDILPEPNRFEPDEMTLRLAYVPFGLQDVIGDVHAHSMGYDRREGDQFRALLGKTGAAARVLFGSIPQFCGGDYYSSVTPSPITMRNARELDIRVAEDFYSQYTDNPAIAAKADLSLTGFDFSDQGGMDVVAYGREKMLEHPGLFKFIGEVTADKELVSIQEGPFDWDVTSSKFQSYLDFAAETGQGILLHNDWGDHAVHEHTGRPQPAKTAYENFDKLIQVFSQEKYQDLNIIFAHTGLGRFVRPDDTLHTGTVRVHTDQGLVEKTIKAPEHIFKLYELFEKVPNARADISWNDVTQAFADNPQLRDSLIDFVIDNQDRLLFGSDTVKPVNSGHYQQALITGSPIFAEIALRNPQALWKLLRGNYETVMANAETRVADWTRDQLTAAGRTDEIGDMDSMLGTLNAHREDMRVEAATAYLRWLDKLTGDISGLSPDQIDVEPGAYPALYEMLEDPERQTWRENVRSQTGLGTSGGSTNDEIANKVTAGVLTAALLGADGYATQTFAADHRFAPGPGDNVSEENATAFALRGALIGLRTLHSEKLRLEWEAIFEEGHVTRDSLNSFMSRFVSAQEMLGLTDGQLARMSAAAEQFWANYQYLRDIPVTPASKDQGWTRAQRFHAIMAKAGEFQITLDRILGTQASSVSPLEGRTRTGVALRTATLATYLVNDAVSVDWLTSGQMDLGTVQGQTQAATNLLFFLGNAALTAQTSVSLASGVAGVTWDTNPRVRTLQAAGNWLLAAGGAAWTASDALNIFTHAAAGGTGRSLTHTALDAIFTYGMYQAAKIETRRVVGEPMPAPANVAKPAILLAGALVLRELLAMLPMDPAEKEDDRTAFTAPAPLADPAAQPPQGGQGGFAPLFGRETPGPAPAAPIAPPLGPVPVEDFLRSRDLPPVRYNVTPPQ